MPQFTNNITNNISVAVNQEVHEEYRGVINVGSLLTINGESHIVNLKQRICDGVYLIRVHVVSKFCDGKFLSKRFFYNKYNPEYLEEFGTGRKVHYTHYSVKGAGRWED